MKVRGSLLYEEDDRQDICDNTYGIGESPDSGRSYRDDKKDYSLEGSPLSGSDFKRQVLVRRHTFIIQDN